MELIAETGIKSTEGNIMLPLNNAGKQILRRLLVDVEFGFSLVNRRIAVQQTRKILRLKRDDAAKIDHAAITFTSQNLGARRYDRIWKIFWNCQLTVMLIGVPLCVLSTVFGPQLLSIYVSADDPARDAVIAMGMIRTYYVTTPYFLCGIMEVCCGMVRGLGKSWLPMVVTIFGACVMRIVWIYTIFAWKHTLPALYVSYPISWVITAAMHVVCFVYFWKRIRRKLEQTAPAAADIRKES